MREDFEFSYQSPKQKILLIILKLLTFLLIVFSLYTLGWSDESFDEKISSAGGVFTGIWVYSNLLRVKIEIQELFVPPFNILHAKEFLIAAFAISIYSLVQTILNIIRLS